MRAAMANGEYSDKKATLEDVMDCTSLHTTLALLGAICKERAKRFPYGKQFADAACELERVETHLFGKRLFIPARSVQPQK